MNFFLLQCSFLSFRISFASSSSPKPLSVVLICCRCHWCAVVFGCHLFTAIYWRRLPSYLLWKLLCRAPMTDSFGRILFRVYCGNCSGNIFLFSLKINNSPFRRRRTKREIAAMQASQRCVFVWEWNMQMNGEKEAAKKNGMKATGNYDAILQLNGASANDTGLRTLFDTIPFSFFIFLLFRDEITAARICTT